MEETISLQELMQTLKKRLGLILLTTVLAVTVAGVISFLYLTPIYEATAEIIVSQEATETDRVTRQDIETDLSLINTYRDIIRSRSVIDQVIEELNLEVSADQLANAITVINAESSQVVDLTVTHTDPEVATQIINTTAEVFEAYVPTVMDVNNVEILTRAVPGENLTPIEPDPMLNMAIAGVVGLMIGVGIAFLLEYLDTSLKNEQDIEEVLQLPVLGLISPIPDKEMVNTDAPTRRRRE